jgi:ketosteroid isomerase-like protein
MSAPQTVLAAMQRTNELFTSEVVAKKNVSALNEIYTANARILPPGADAVEGREPIKMFWQQAIAALGVKNVKLTTVDAQPIGDGVFEIGSADLTLNNGQNVACKYVVLWKQENGSWKWHVDIWNQNQ